jgi:hypothetical protein
MSSTTSSRPFVICSLDWLIENPPTQPSAGLTAFREAYGRQDLFSVFVRFGMDDVSSASWDRATIFALVEEMESRLPSVGETIVITAGIEPIAKATVLAVGSEVV